MTRAERKGQGQDEQLERLLRQLADVPQVVKSLADFVDSLVQSRIPRR